MLLKGKKTGEFFRKLGSIGLTFWGTGLIMTLQPEEETSKGEAGF